MERPCPHCQRAFDATESRCPHCGQESDAWKLHEGKWWARREGRWWIRDETTETWKPHIGPGGLEPETVDGWAILEMMKVQTSLLRQITFWVTIFGVLTLLGVAVSIASLATGGY